jgi:hypothetical protein
MFRYRGEAEHVNKMDNVLNGRPNAPSAQSQPK